MSVASRQITAGPPPCAAGKRTVHIIQGEYYVTDDPRVMLTTLLGSCVAACLRDPDLAIGGMNHFLLPGQAAAKRSACAPAPGRRCRRILLILHT
jgi:chemotaxis protein CheD